MPSHRRRDHRDNGHSSRLFRGLLISQVFLLPWLILWCHEQMLVASEKDSDWTASLPFLDPTKKQHSRPQTPPASRAPTPVGQAGLSIAVPTTARSFMATEPVASLPRFESFVVADPLASDSAFTGSDLLGGSMGLADLASPSIQGRELAARARAIRIGDPFSPLPSSYRQPMRVAVGELQKQTGPRRIEPARLVHLPSRLIKKPVSVPVVLQSDGSVDVLNRPDDQRVVEDIRQWSSRQALPGSGSVEPAVVVVQPLPNVAPSGQAAQSTQAVWIKRSLAPVTPAPAQPQAEATPAAGPTSISVRETPSATHTAPVQEFSTTNPTD